MEPLNKLKITSGHGILPVVVNYIGLKPWVSRGVRNQYIAGFAASLSMLATGTCYGWITPILTDLRDPDSAVYLTTIQLSWVVSIIEIGFMISSIPCGILINYFGRKPVLLATFPIFLIGWIAFLCFPNATVLAAARLIHGLAMGAIYTVVPVYLGEISSDGCRGAITSMAFNAWWLGFVIEYSVGPFLSFYNFTYFTIALHVPFIVLFVWQSETPYYYAMIGDVRKAQESLEWFRDSTPEQLKEELENVKNSKGSQEKVALKDLFSKAGDRKAVFVLCAVASVRVLGGTGSLVVLLTEIFSMTPNLSIDPDIVTIIGGVVMFVGGCVSSFTLDIFGRRLLLLISCFGSLLCQLLAGTYYYLLFNTNVKVSQFSWVAPILIFVYFALSTAGIYPVCSAYSSELFNTNTRGVATSLSSICVTSISFFMLLLFQPITDFIGLYANFYMFSLFLILGSVYFYISAPETKGKSFSQIREELMESN